MPDAWPCHLSFARQLLLFLFLQRKCVRRSCPESSESSTTTVRAGTAFCFVDLVKKCKETAVAKASQTGFMELELNAQAAIGTW
jgi:hypothetical protein